MFSSPPVINAYNTAACRFPKGSVFVFTPLATIASCHCSTNVFILCQNLVQALSMNCPLFIHQILFMSFGRSLSARFRILLLNESKQIRSVSQPNCPISENRARIALFRAISIQLSAMSCRSMLLNGMLGYC